MKQESKFHTYADAVKVIKSGDRVHISGVAGYPQGITTELYKRGLQGELKNVTIQYLHNIGESPFANQEAEGIFNLEVMYTGANIRKQLNAGYAHYIPVHLYEAQRLMREGIINIDVAIIQISEPDKHGYASLGTSVDINPSAIESAKIVIGVINPHVPRAFGDAMIKLSDIDIFCKDETPLTEIENGNPSESDITIAKYCAELIEDGATLQVGIGNLPDAVLQQLNNHKNLGIHTEMFSNGILPLYYNGVINNSQKKLDRGKIVASFLMGTKELYDFIDDNPSVLMQDVGYTNNPFIIAKQPKMTAINSAISIDLTGQINSDSIGTMQYSGCGGQLDFVRGANASEGGKSIIAMPSTTTKGISKISSTLDVGSNVVTTRADAHYIVTEYGYVDLFGKTLQARAKALIEIAHPNYRETLDREAFERFGSHFHYIS